MKDTIRERYKGISPEELQVIPAKPEINVFESELRVAVYVRVSTDDPRQTTSYELQRNHYVDFVNQKPNWKLTEIYADEGISGTSLHNRVEFIRMIEDCKAGKIDFIVTKSVSRFARNVLDCIGHIRMLKDMQPPIGIFFETEGINTLEPKSEMGLSFIATLAQEESRNKSDIMNASIEMRFKRGIFLTPTLLGYDHDEDKNLVINETEANTVRLIFFTYLYGYSTQQIADLLKGLKLKTKKGNTSWSASSISQILANERHCGDVIARKTWTPNYLDHKSRKNKEDRNQYRHENHHEAIIRRDDFLAVQRLMQNAKYGNRSILPELQVVNEGTLTGFVSINPRWSGFTVQDYFTASSSAGDSSSDLELEVTADTGDFDFRGYEVARSQFFDSHNKVSLTFSTSVISTTMACIRKLPENHFVELLIHPAKQLLAIRPVKKDSKNAIQWSTTLNGELVKKHISGAAYLPTLFLLFKWDENCKYRVTGSKKQSSDGTILIFDLSETEVFLSDFDSDEGVNPITYGRKKSVRGYPSEWAHGFGNNYYHQTELDYTICSEEQMWGINIESVPYKELDLDVSTPEQLEMDIQKIIENSGGNNVESTE